MKTMVTRLLWLFPLVAVPLVVFAGHPGPVHRQPAEHRQALLFLVGFQDALAEERWNDALSCCSARVRARAAEWPAPADFIHDTMPVEHMLSHDLFCSRCGSNFYGMHEPLTEPEATDRVDWCWAVSQENGKWVVDFPPEKLDAFVARKKAALAEMRELVSNIRNHVVEKLKSVQTRLVASSSQFQIGSPMLFRLETVNSGNEEVGFSNFGIRYHPLVVWDANGQKIPLPADKDSGQLAVGRTKLPPGATEIVADKLDLAAFYKLDAPGKYHVQFDGTKLSFGEITNTMPGISRFGEDDASLSRFDFAGLITVTNTIPSAAVEFEVVP